MKGKHIHAIIKENLLFSLHLISIILLLPLFSPVTCHANDSVPQTWQYNEMVSQTLPTDDQWWKNFNDKVLDSLINMAENNNYNLKAALKRIERARQTLRAAKGAYSPEINLSASWNKTRTSGAITQPVTAATNASEFDLGIDMSWEIDVFGRIKENVKANKASLNSTRAEYAAAMVSLCSEVAKTYINLRMYQQQLTVAQEHLVSQQKVVDLANARYEAGIGNMLEVSQARIVLYSTRASIPSTKALIQTSINSLATLTGQYPAEMSKFLYGTSMDFPNIPEVTDGDIPSDLLRRRPDIVQAEAQMALAAAQCGIAKRDFLPVLSLDASAGTASHHASNLFTGRSFNWSVQPTLTWTLFDGMIRNAHSAEAKLNLEAATDSYNNTVLNAVQEVDNAMTNYRAAFDAVNLRKEVIEQSQKSFELSLALYKRGLTLFSNVTDAMITLLDNQNILISSQGEMLTSYVSIYEALGGGF